MLFVEIKKRVPGFHLDVSFEAENEVLGLLGASGCGKSMTLRAIAGIETPDEGRIVLDGRILFDSTKRINLPPQKRRVGLLFQNAALFPNMTVLQNIAVGARTGSRRERLEKAAVPLHTFGLDSLSDHFPATLSGGERQRAALARILLNEPSALLLDEPLTALDSYLRWRLELELSDVLTTFPGTTIFVSHNQDEVYRLCQRACVLTNGKSEQTARVDELFSAPRTRTAALLSGCKNLSRARMLDATHAEALDWGVTLTLPEGAEADFGFLGIRAHFIRLCTAPEEQNAVPCTIVKIMEDVFSTLVMLKTPGGKTELRAELSKDSWSALARAERLFAILPPEQLILLSN